MHKGEKISGVVQYIKKGFFKRGGETPYNSDISGSSQSNFLGSTPHLDSEPGIDYADLNLMVKNYWEGTFRRYVNRSDLAVTDITSTTDLTRSQNNKDLQYFFSEGRFNNFSINHRNYAGRVRSNIVVRRTKSSKGKVTYNILPEDQIEKIILLVSDSLSDDQREAMIKARINEHYKSLDINIQKSRLEIYPDEICSYVTAVVDKDKIMYLRISFQINPPISPLLYEGIEIIQTSWALKGAEEISSYPFPEDDQIRKDARADLFSYFSRKYRKASAEKSGIRIIADFPKLSGIRPIPFQYKEPLEAKEESVKFAIEFQYRLGVPLKQIPFSVQAIINYKYDFQEKKWEYQSIEVMKD